MTQSSLPLSYESPDTDAAVRRFKFARLIFLANALTFLGLGLTGAAITAIPQILKLRVSSPYLPFERSSDFFSAFLIFGLAPTFIGALFLYSFAKLRTNTPLAATIVRRMAFGIMPALIALAILMSVILISSWFGGWRSPVLAANFLMLGACTAGTVFLGFTAWIAGRIRDETEHRPPTP
jgi:hypothetical protein